ncbi:MAG: 2-oxo acid dehydrogenase subunit E2, partial [Rhodoferax sp.]|nr:2-oxo acid dehydrogenase subunit E2 [Rhodoferax sp.]
MIEFKLPSLGADMTEGKLLAWHVQPGDCVKRGQVVAVVDTSKAAIDVEIWNEGVVHELRVPVGDKVPVGTVLATLLAPGEAPPNMEPKASTQAPATPAPPAGQVFAAPSRQNDMRQAIAAAMSRSKREIPHYYLAETIPLQAALDWLQQRNAGQPITERLLPAVLLLKAVAVALTDRPELNGFYVDGQFQPI